MGRKNRNRQRREFRKPRKYTAYSPDDACRHAIYPAHACTICNGKDRSPQNIKAAPAARKVTQSWSTAPKQCQELASEMFGGTYVTAKE